MIYDSYEQEPKDIFKKLSQTRYAEMYENDMGAFKEDLQFYTNFLKSTDHIIEVGCGTGRISSFLYNSGYNIIGLDFSQDMLDIVSKKCSSLPTIKADITTIKLQNKFDKILAPYNFLNLFLNSELDNTIKTCKNHLKSHGKLIGEINCLDPKSDLAQSGSSFQFQISDNDKGRIIKEIKRKFIAKNNTILVEERYRIRENSGIKEDYNNSYMVNAYDFTTWQEIINKHDLQITNYYSDYCCEKQDVKNKLLFVIKHKG